MYTRGQVAAAAQDTLVAQDLQLTSSESGGDPLDHEGGELMDDTTAAVVAAEEGASGLSSHYSVCAIVVLCVFFMYSIHLSNRNDSQPDLASDRANDGFDSRSDDTPIADANCTRGNCEDEDANESPFSPQHVEFFIGSDEEDDDAWNSRESLL